MRLRGAERWNEYGNASFHAGFAWLTEPPPHPTYQRAYDGDEDEVRDFAHDAALSDTSF